MRMKWLAALVMLAGCADPVAWGRDISGEWYLRATAGADCEMIARMDLSPTASGFTGQADVGFTRHEDGRDVSWGGTGFRVEGSAHHIVVAGHDLRATHESEDAMGGNWTCSQTPGTWTLDREEW